jgi:hypothetical protein
VAASVNFAPAGRVDTDAGRALRRQLCDTWDVGRRLQGGILGSFRTKSVIAKAVILGTASLVATPAIATLASATPPATVAPATKPQQTQNRQNWQLIGETVFTGAAAAARNQGVTTDGTHWYFSSSDGLEITDMQYHTLMQVSPAIPPELANPGPLAYKGLNHIGDMDYANGLLYIALDSSVVDPNIGIPLDGINQYNTPVFATYNASNLTFTGHAVALHPPDGVNDIASWTAVDSKRGLAYGMAYVFGTEIAVYNLPNWTFTHYIELSQQVDQVQGGKVHDGWIYFSSNLTKSISRANLKTGQVQNLFTLPNPLSFPNPLSPQEVEGLSFLQTPQGLTLNILDKQQPDTSLPYQVTFYHYLLAGSAPTR